MKTYIVDKTYFNSKYERLRGNVFHQPVEGQPDKVRVKLVLSGGEPALRKFIGPKFDELFVEETDAVLS